MNAPYDGDRGDAAANSGHPESDPAGVRRPARPGVTATRRHVRPGRLRPGPLPGAAHRRPGPGHRGALRPVGAPAAPARRAAAAAALYGQPPQSPYAPDPGCGGTPAPEPDGPTQYLPYGDDPRTTQYVGVDDLVGQAGEQRHEPDAFAHLFRDQQQSGAFPDQHGGHARPQGGAHPGQPVGARSNTPPRRCPDPRPHARSLRGRHSAPAAESAAPEPASAPAPKGAAAPAAC